MWSHISNALKLKYTHLQTSPSYCLECHRFDSGGKKKQNSSVLTSIQCWEIFQKGRIAGRTRLCQWKFYFKLKLNTGISGITLDTPCLNPLTLCMASLPIWNQTHECMWRRRMDTGMLHKRTSVLMFQWSSDKTLKIVAKMIADPHDLSCHQILKRAAMGFFSW